MPPIDAITAEVDVWFAEQMQQPPISYSVEAYNQAHTACADLKRRLHVVVTGEAPPPIVTGTPSEDAGPDEAKAGRGTKA